MKQTAPGFSFVEMMAVIVIIGILATFMFPRVGKLFDRAKETKTTAVMQTLQSGLQQYYIDVGKYPSTRDGLEALLVKPRGRDGDFWKGPYLDGAQDVPLDGWNRDFDYNSPPQEYAKKYTRFEIISGGSNPDDGNDLHSGS